MDDLSSSAIKLNLVGDWDEAVKLNIAILSQDPTNTAALNRLAKAQSELGKIKESSLTYRKVLKIDPLNQIAQKNLERLKMAKPDGVNKNRQAGITTLTQDFIEEPGKSKSISLVKLGAPQTISSITPGEIVELAPRQHSISVTSTLGSTIGRLPDDISARLLPMIKSGNIYQCVVRSVAPNSVKIFIKEIKRSKRFSNTPSFPTSDHTQYIAYIPPELVHEELSVQDETEDSAP